MHPTIQFTWIPEKCQELLCLYADISMKCTPTFSLIYLYKIINTYIRLKLAQKHNTRVPYNNNKRVQCAVIVHGWHEKWTENGSFFD